MDCKYFDHMITNIISCVHIEITCQKLTNQRIISSILGCDMQSGKQTPPKQKSVIIMVTMVRTSTLNLFHCHEGKVQQVLEL